jgi:hypothetical protein
MKTRLIQFAVLTFTSFAALAAETSVPPTASALLDKYQTALDNFRSVILKQEVASVCTNRISDPQGQKISGRPMKTYYRSEFRSDGTRHAWRQSAWGNVGSAKQVTPESQAAYWSSFWDGREKHDLGAGYVTFHTPPPTPDEASRMLGNDGEMRGYLSAIDRRLDALVRTARILSVRTETETINGSACYVIDAVTDQGKVCLWIDPAHGYLAAKVTLSVIAGNSRLGQRVPAGTSDQRSLEVTRFEQKGVVWVPMAMKSFDQLELGRGEFSHSSTTYKCTEVIFNPDHDALHSFDWTHDPELKDGTLIHQIGPGGFEQARFVWQGGKPVPDTSWHRRGR